MRISVCSPWPTAWAATRRAKVAAQLAIDAITGFISRSANDYDVTWPYGIDDALSFDGNRLRTAIFLANRNVFRAAESSDDYGGMGTTIVGLLLTGDHAGDRIRGDSRVYLLAGGTFEQVTTHDSWAATLLAQDPKHDARRRGAPPDAQRPHQRAWRAAPRWRSTFTSAS